MEYTFKSTQVPFQIRGMSHNLAYSDPFVLGQTIEKAIVAAGCRLDGWVQHRRNAADIVEPLGDGGVAKLLTFAGDPRPLRKVLALNGGEVEFLWLPEEMLALHWVHNLSIRIRLASWECLGDAIQTLSTFAETCDFFWGEAIALGNSTRPTFCDPNSHYHNVPLIGHANYFGPEYIEYFGGKDRMAAAPHLTVMPCHTGTIVMLDECNDVHDFEAKQCDVVCYLGKSLFELAENQPPIQQSLFYQTEIPDRNANLTDTFSEEQIDTNSPLAKQQQSEEEQHVFRLALKSALAAILGQGCVLPTVFAHLGDSVTYFSYEADSLEQLRDAAQEILESRCPAAIAYAVVYDSSLDVGDKTIDALEIEVGSRSKIARLFAVPYNKQTMASTAPKQLQLVDSILHRD